MNNKKLGNNFEKEMAEILSKEGYWVLLVTPKGYINSQPCDLIAIKNDRATLIDCKVCKTHIFQLRRIEENQWQAYKKYKKCGNNDFVLAVKYNKKIYIIPLDIIDKNKKSIDLDTINKDTIMYSWERKNE